MFIHFFGDILHILELFDVRYGSFAILVALVISVCNLCLLSIMRIQGDMKTRLYRHSAHYLIENYLKIDLPQFGHVGVNAVVFAADM